MNKLVTKIEELLPKEKGLLDEYSYGDIDEDIENIGYNQAISDIKQTLPQILDLIRQELKEHWLKTGSGNIPNYLDLLK